MKFRLFLCEFLNTFDNLNETRVSFFGVHRAVVLTCRYVKEWGKGNTSQMILKVIVEWIHLIVMQKIKERKEDFSYINFYD